MTTLGEHPTLRRRITDGELELREYDDGSDVGPTVAGYFAVFDQPAHGEVVRSGAFERTLAEGDDVVLRVDHSGLPLASTKSGTLRLHADDRGLYGIAEDLDRGNPDVLRLESTLRRGDVDKASFAFTEEPGANGFDEREELYELRGVRLWDVSVVTYPWYDATDVGLNELDEALVALRDGRPITVRQAEILERRVATAEADVRGALRPHSTDTTDSTWDGPAAVAGAPNDADVLRYMHAWVDSDGDADAKSSYKFPHHAPEVGSPANLGGVRNALARLSNANIPDGDRAGVEAHLRRHLEDADTGDDDRNIDPEPAPRRGTPLEVARSYATAFRPIPVGRK